MSGPKGISSFSVVLVMAVTAVVGLACFSQLKVQYAPSAPDRSVSVSWSYPGASARVVEAEVTSLIEGRLANIRHCTGIKSVSHDGDGYVRLSVGKRADLDAVRFEASSQVRNLWTSLPEGCSYPVVSLDGGEDEAQGTAISYQIRSPLPSRDIARFVKERIMHPLSVIDGVSDVRFNGDTPYEWVITLDADKALSCGISSREVTAAVSSYYADEVLGMAHDAGSTYGVRLRSGGVRTETDFSSIPVKKVGGRVVHLGEIASFRYQEALPRSYYRINGLNTLELAVSASDEANLIEVVKKVRTTMSGLEKGFPEEITASVSYDYTEYLQDELDKIYFRTGMCLLILLLFVFLVNRSWRYMAVIGLTLAVNLLISVAFYYFTGLHIHIYTLAGITVSLGIIIDNSIVMIDHWTRYRTRSVFPALLSAVLTTVAALLVVLLLPEKERANLSDFTYVIVINLCVSLVVAYLFVPALLDYLPVRRSEVRASVRRQRRVVRWNGRYERYINWGMRHRWVLVVAFIAAFGIPTFFLPEPDAGRGAAGRKSSFRKALEKVSAWTPYAENRRTIDKVLGSTFALFNEAMSRSDFYREPERKRLDVVAGMPEGCSVQQLNEVMRSMENYLAHFDEIEMFETSIYSARNGRISVLFKPEYENTSAPVLIKQEVVSMASDLGGANWRVAGIDDSYFNNNILTDYKMFGITLTGYNYDDLLSYGNHLADHLSRNRRVKGPEVWGGEYYDRPSTEFTVDYDFEALTSLGVSPYGYYSSLSSPLYRSSVMRLPEEGGYVDVRLESSARDGFDVWHVDNEAVGVGDRKVKLSEVGGISKKRTGITIRKENQSYVLSVRYDFIGSYQLSEKLKDEAISYMNSEVLPTGYKASYEEYRWFYENKDRYAGLILLVIAIIFVICAVHFNSFRYPLAIIWMISISFIGLFLVFGLTDFTFDKGGFAAFVMLSGITVNAGIYLVSAWRQSRTASSEVRRYVKSFDRKIWPVSLTILSTILGLVPFLFDGPGEVFWFSFAIGTIGGMVFSVLAFVLYLPVFCLKKGK